MQARQTGDALDYVRLARLLLRVYGAVILLYSFSHLAAVVIYGVPSPRMIGATYLLVLNPAMTVIGAALLVFGGSVARWLVDNPRAAAAPSAPAQDLERVTYSTIGWLYLGSAVIRILTVLGEFCFAPSAHPLVLLPSELPLLLTQMINLLMGAGLILGWRGIAGIGARLVHGFATLRRFPYRE
jgi:hypothetical protein